MEIHTTCYVLLCVATCCYVFLYKPILSQQRTLTERGLECRKGILWRVVLDQGHHKRAHRLFDQRLPLDVMQGQSDACQSLSDIPLDTCQFDISKCKNMICCKFCTIFEQFLEQFLVSMCFAIWICQQLCKTQMKTLHSITANLEMCQNDQHTTTGNTNWIFKN